MRLKALGIDIDTVGMVLCLPPKKLKELQELVEMRMARKCYGHQQPQSLAGMPAKWYGQGGHCLGRYSR